MKYPTVWGHYSLGCGRRRYGRIR